MRRRARVSWRTSFDGRGATDEVERRRETRQRTSSAIAGGGRRADFGVWTARASRTVPRARGAPGDSRAIDGFDDATFVFGAQMAHRGARGRRRDRKRRTAGSSEDASGWTPRVVDEKRRTGAHLGSGRRVRGCGANGHALANALVGRGEQERKAETLAFCFGAFVYVLLVFTFCRSLNKNPPLGGSWQSRLQDPDASGLGAPRVTSGAARQGDTGVPRRGTAHAKRFAWPPPARARRETHSGSSRLVDG